MMMLGFRIRVYTMIGICKTHMSLERTTLRNIFDQVLFALDAKIPFLSAKINMFFEQNYTKECDGLK